ncbi:hypothetical protein Kpol_538p14 [Vanderwaltozyma polyspora DSM 70294]|uniref:Uncharacterized protein n=1 Tax=Vanderwaltozyma polyspora (strain ATCC 22028 / DSM 70294 / BCRC 21397 / CBS 2163 / NBRC 10782 / NRRL Y-8283 / UCD 57-17) TaxID=436907 RepID=A7TKC7_VANPO|nr:uncharacterized protein Kpol_538p14 [Vanderwaltozyma polyspora DSM 70294]EDO17254.1 hypothetical protein Kpol_538p14 [Vanderwaltozyma polyspora DSM 70294]
MSEQRPIRIAVLGGDSTGKTSLVSRLTLDMVHEVHYPTRTQTNWLFEFIPRSNLAKAILDNSPHERLLLRSQSSQKPQPIFDSPSISPYILLSPLVFQSYINDFTKIKTQHKKSSSNNNHLKQLNLITSDTPYYSYLDSSKEIDHKKRKRNLTAGDINPKIKDIESSVKLPPNYIPPNYTPIPIDIIDTPGFKPEMVVPFLEVSLFRNLGKNVLKGLANEPRRPVSTTSLLVASGASELNGKIDGYIFVYSSVPELSHIRSPPQYSRSDSQINLNFAPNESLKDDSSGKTTVTTSSNSSYSWSSFQRKNDGGYSLLEIIRNSMLDAWTEFRNYQTRWNKGKESDVYSLVYSFKNMWKTEKERNEKLQQLRSFNTTLDSIDLEPSSPDAPPPAIIVCTHVGDPLSSPLLIEKGRALATQWKCGFVALDNMDDCNVDVSISLLIRDIVEKEKLLSGSNNGKNNNTTTANSLMNFIKV